MKTYIIKGETVSLSQPQSSQTLQKHPVQTHHKHTSPSRRIHNQDQLRNSSHDMDFIANFKAWIQGALHTNQEVNGESLKAPSNTPAAQSPSPEELSGAVSQTLHERLVAASPRVNNLHIPRL